MMYVTIYDQLDDNGDGFVIDFDKENRNFRITHFSHYHFDGDMVIPEDDLLMFFK